MSTLILRPMVDGDLDVLHALERAATAFPWSLRQLSDSLRCDDSTVLQCDQFGIVGWVIFQRVLDEVTLLNIVVDVNRQGSGLGKKLLLGALQQQFEQGVGRCFLEVRESNLQALALYRNLGFSQIGLRKAYYPSVAGREHAIVMEKILDDAVMSAGDIV